MKKITKVLIIILGIIAFIGLHLTIRYLVNESFINNYNDEEYKNGAFKILKIINVPESYIVYYNEGNYYYQVKEYDKAILSYEKALDRVNKERVCDVRHNLALTRLQTLDYENNKNLKYELESVQEVLLEDNCATEDNNGEHKPAQDLYNKIEELLKQNGQEQGGGDGDEDEDDQDDDNNNNNDNNDQKDKEIEQKIRNQQKQAASERQKINKTNYDYYKGKSW